MWGLMDSYTYNLNFTPTGDPMPFLYGLRDMMAPGPRKVSNKTKAKNRARNKMARKARRRNALSD